MAEVFISIGSNLGDRRKNIALAIEYLRQTPGIAIERISTLIESIPDQAIGPNYLNGVVKINTEIIAKNLLAILHDIENKLGRVRVYRNCPRSIDLDILLYDYSRINEPDLIIPHPRMFERKFVIEPLSEIIERRQFNEILRLKENTPSRV